MGFGPERTLCVMTISTVVLTASTMLSNAGRQRMQEGRPGIAGIAGEETTAILQWHTRDANKQHVIGLIGLQLYLPHTVLLRPVTVSRRILKEISR